MSNLDLWSRLRCPACAGTLTRELFDGTPEAPGAGLLRCACGLWFPIVDGIPRIFVGAMRSIYARDFADFLERHQLRDDDDGDGRDSASAAPPLDRQTTLKLATRDSFGYEWTHFHEMLPEWEQNASFYFEPLGDLAQLDGKLVLDAGCGKGRHAYYAAKQGARVIACDFSRAIDVAQRNCRALPGDRLFVQADIMNLPFAPETFDIGYSFGVLHHLPDPEAGFAALVKLTRPHGRVAVYLYHALENEPVKQLILRGVDLARQVTTRLPHRLLLPLTNLLGYGLYGFVVTPYKIFSRFALTQPLADAMPLKSYADYPVRVIVNDQFDRFSAPIENRYTRAQVVEWLTRAGLRRTTILGGAGWRASGERA